MYTNYGYVGLADGILYCTMEDALEANPKN